MVRIPQAPHASWNTWKADATTFEESACARAIQHGKTSQVAKDAFGATQAAGMLQAEED